MIIFLQDEPLYEEPPQDYKNPELDAPPLPERSEEVDQDRDYDDVIPPEEKPGQCLFGCSLNAL